MEFIILNENQHCYSLATSDGIHDFHRDYATREQAQKAMYKLCSKYGVRIVKVYDDKHDKTYICNTGERFHINRW